MTVPKNYAALKKIYDALESDEKSYLIKLEPLLSDAKNYEIALAYCYMKLEEGHHRALKCGLIRIHACDARKVDEYLQKQHFTNKTYNSVFKNIIGTSIPSKAQSVHSDAQEIRNKIIHGKSVSSPDLRSAIYYSLEYMRIVGELVKKKTGKNPYGNLQGLAGTKKLLPAKSTIWMLKGFGIDGKDNATIA